MTRDPFTRPLGTAPGEAFHTRNRLIDPAERQLVEPRGLGDFAVAMLAAAMIWAVILYVLFY